MSERNKGYENLFLNFATNTSGICSSKSDTSAGSCLLVPVETLFLKTPGQCPYS